MRKFFGSCHIINQCKVKKNPPMIFGGFLIFERKLVALESRNTDATDDRNTKNGFNKLDNSPSSKDNG